MLGIWFLVGMMLIAILCAADNYLYFEKVMAQPDIYTNDTWSA